MTEDQWNSCTDPTAMLGFLQRSDRASERKLRLFAVACCRRAGKWLGDSRSRNAVNLAERLADGTAREAELESVGWEARDAAEATARQVSLGADYAAARAAEACLYACSPTGVSQLAREAAIAA